MAVALGHELKRLIDATDPSENKMFLNVVKGAAKSEVLAVATKELAEAGLQSTIVLGPLLLKTNGKETAEQGGQSIVLPMPILVKSTYAVMQKATSQAYEKLVAGGDDPEMVLGKGRDKPKFGHQSCRGWQTRWQRRRSHEEDARRRISICTLDGSWRSTRRQCSCTIRIGARGRRERR